MLTPEVRIHLANYVLIAKGCEIINERIYLWKGQPVTLSQGGNLHEVVNVAPSRKRKDK